MAFDLKEINFRTVADPKGFIEECDDVYASRVTAAHSLWTFSIPANPTASSYAWTA